MKAKFSVFVQKIIIQTYKLDRKLAEKIERKIALFESNSTHPSLRLHKLSGSLKNRWSISITTHIRMIYILTDDGAYFFDIGTHDEVYKK